MATPTSTKTRALADLMVAALVDANASHSLHYSQTQASCLVSRVIAGIGEPRLVELGAGSGDDLSVLRWTASERARVFDAMRACVDIHAQLVSFFGSDGSVSDNVADCVATAYEKSDVLPEALISPGPDAVVSNRIDSTLRAAFQACS